jgi:nicotinamidase-related amidase
MQIGHGAWLRRAVMGAVGCLIATPAPAQTIVDEWASVKPPPPPALKPVSVDPRTTALLLLDFNQQTCNAQRRPRCVASVPRVKPLLAAARAAGVPVVYSLGGGGKPTDILPELVPTASEPVVSSGVDKFMNTDLEKILKDKGIATVIVAGTSAHGAVLHTASAAAMRGLKVIVPVDGISGDTTYVEQYTAWHLVNAPVFSQNVTLTTLDGVKF